MNMPIVLTFAILLASLRSVPTQAPADEPWVGKLVILKPEAVLRDGKAVVTRRGVIFRVTKAKDAWLMIVAEKGRAGAWVRPADVVPFEQAFDFLAARIRANPADAEAFERRGQIHAETQELDLAIADYDEAIRLNPKRASAWANRSRVWFDKKDLDRVISDSTEAIRLDPKDATARSCRGHAFVGKKEYDLAITEFSEQIRLDLKDIDPVWNRGIAFSEKGDHDHAIADFTEVIRRSPNNAQVYYNRGSTHYRKGDYEHAIADFTEHIRLDPKGVWGYTVRAWIWATCTDEKYRDGEKAVESETKACKLSDWKATVPIATLAAAYAEAGDFAAAVKWQSNLIDLFINESDKTSARSQLKLYQAKKPHRDPKQ